MCGFNSGSVVKRLGALPLVLGWFGFAYLISARSRRDLVSEIRDLEEQGLLRKTPCDKPVPVSETVTRTIIPPIDVDRPCFVDDAEDVLPQSKLECIASSTEMRDALKNEELQKLIRNIDCSANAETELEKAMEQEVFRLFTEKTFVPFALQVPRYDILTSRIAFLKVAAGTAQVVKQYSLLIPDNVKGHVLKLSLSPST
ncbi:hypothetical protein Tco_1301264 [Tanacetum coccineum]